MTKPSFGSASPGDTQGRRGPECRAAPSKSAGREAGALTPSLLATPRARPSASSPPVGLSNGRSQLGAGLPGLRAETPVLSIRGALGVCTAHVPVHAFTPTSNPGERYLSHGAAAPQQACTASPRVRLLRDTGRSAAGWRGTGWPGLRSGASGTLGLLSRAPRSRALPQLAGLAQDLGRGRHRCLRVKPGAAAPSSFNSSHYCLSSRRSGVG